MIKKIFILFILCFAILVSMLTDAVAQKEEELDVKYPTIPAEEVVEEIIPLEMRKVERWDVGIGASVSQGFDNNASLDSTRIDDMFTQGTLDLDIGYKLSDISELKGGYILTDITYWEYTDASLLDNIAAIGLENNLSDNLILYTGYELEVLYYPENELSNYVGNRGEVSLKHMITESLYQKMGYDYWHKGYNEKRARDAVNNLSRHREDNRHTIKYEIGTYLEKLMLKLKGTAYHNDSNDKYLDYYDYNSYKAALSIIYLFTDKIYIYTSGGYEFRDYKNRSIVNKTEDQQDDIWTLNCALFYDFAKYFSLGINYSYRENASNDKSQEYAGGIVSAGLYFTF